MMKKIADYTFEKSIGKGAFSTVYLTNKKDDTKKYATKIYERLVIDNDNNSKICLKNEISYLKFLNHPNIIKFQDLKKSKDHYFLIEEYCNGGTLLEALEKYMKKYGKPFSEEIVQYFMRQIIEAFKYIHSKKIVHKNISLYHILLNYENEEDAKNFNLMKAQIKINNFSFAEKVVDIVYSATFNGPPHDDFNSFIGRYKDPYILSKKGYSFNEETDIWAIGCIYYEMLTGKTIFIFDEMEEKKINFEKLIYYIPISFSFETISFINGMLQFDKKQRLNASELSKHDFLNKNVNQFKKIDFDIPGKINSGMLEIDVKNNTNIWSIFNNVDKIPKEKEL